MATLAGGLAGGGAGEAVPSSSEGRWVFLPAGAATLGAARRFYKMQAEDPDCMSLTYRTWVVVDDPDLTGAQYVGTRCGVSPLVNIVIADAWLK